MRLLFLDSSTIDFGRGILILPILVLLYVLAPFSKSAEAAMNGLFGKEKDEGELELRTGPVRVLVYDGTVNEEEELVGLGMGLEHD